MVKIPLVSPQELSTFCKCTIEESEFFKLPSSEQKLLSGLSEGASHYCAAQTGLSVAESYDYACPGDLRYAVKVVAAEMYDNRQMTAQYSTTNPMVRAILGQYSINLLPEADADA